MGCIKSKEIIHIDSISQQNLEPDLSAQHFIKDNSKNNKEKTQLIFHNNINNNFCDSCANDPMEEKNSNVNSSAKNDNSASVNNNNEMLAKKGENESLKMKKYLTKAENSTIEDNYKIISKLGKGSFGSVFKVRSLKSNEIRAMKVIKKSSIAYQDDDQKFLKEIEILITLDHPNIIKIYEYYTDELNYYLITDYISNGELSEYVAKAKVLSEKQTQNIMTQLLCAVNYLHSNNIAHRDIKLENVLVEKVTETNNEKMLSIKLIDFGTSNYIKKKNTSNFTIKVGSPFYMAPEVLNKKYNNKCDIWSCGVLMFILLKGYPPFKGQTEEELFNNIKNTVIKFDEIHDLSPQAKDLLSKMLERDVKMRFSAKECLKHRWIKIYSEKQNVSNEVVHTALTNISNYNATEKLQQATIAYIVHFVSPNNEVEDLKKVFSQFDKNNDGHLSYEEIDKAFNQYFTDKNNFQSFTQKNKIYKVLDKIDTGKTGRISYEQFLQLSMNQKEILNEKNLKSAFEKFDFDQDGKLSKEEIKNVLGENDFQYVNELLKLVDMNKDGYLSFEEFKSLMDCVLTKKNVEVKKEKEVSNKNLKLKKTEEENYDSDGSFGYISEEKKENKFDREKFLLLVESEHTRLSDEEENTNENGYTKKNNKSKNHEKD